MLIINKDNRNNILEMINVSSLKGKEKRLIYDSNIEIHNYYPLPVPSFAKLKTLYKIENIKELKQCIYFNGLKLNEKELNFIKTEREKYIKKHKDSNIIKFSNKEFINNNFFITV